MYCICVIYVHQWPKQTFPRLTKIKRLARKFARNAPSRKRSKTLVLFVVTIFHGRFRVNTVIFKQCVGPLKTSEGIKFTKKLQRFLVVITKVPANQAISGENTVGFGSDGRGGEKKKRRKGEKERKKERRGGERGGKEKERGGEKMEKKMDDTNG